MLFFSDFARYMNQNGRYIPKKKRDDIRRRAVTRLTERLQAGRADSPLTFDDLFNEAEAYVSGRR